MDNENSGLVSLNRFVTEFLSSTTNIKRILEAECEEARYVLRPWPIETTIMKEIDYRCCTCESRASLEDHVEEIVKGIGKALAQAQQLREKIAINVSKENRKAREPSLQTIYGPAVPKGTKLLSKKDQSAQKSSTKSSNLKSIEAASKSTTKSQCVQTNNIDTKTVTEKKLLRTSLGNTMIKKNVAKPQKNFVAANKSNIKNLRSFSKSTIDLTSQAKKKIDSASSSDKSKKLSTCSSSIAELNNLVDKISIAERKNSSGISSLQSEDYDCPVHGKNSQRFIEEKISTTVDMIEGLDRYGLPNDIVRIFKMDHLYLNDKLVDETIVKRGRRAADKFLDEFNIMNEERASKIKTNDPVNLLKDFASLFRDSHLIEEVSTIKVSEIRSINQRYTELDARSKNSNLKKFDATEFRKPKLSTKTIENNTGRGLSNGVWNSAIIPDSFPGISQDRCIRYNNKSELLSFFENTQRLQRLIYHRDLIDLLLTKVIPDIRGNYDPTSEEYRQAYKMIFTVAQLLNPRIAILVRTDL